MQQHDHGSQYHPGPTTSDPNHLLCYLQVLIKHQWMIFRVTLAVFLMAIAMTLLMTKVYSSTAKILPPQPDQGIMGMLVGQMGGMASLAGDLLGKGSPTEMYVSILRSADIQDAIIRRFDLMKVYSQKYRLDTYQLLEKRVEIEAGKKDGIISVTVHDKDPQRATDMANAYVEELGKMLVALNISGAGRNRSFYEERLAKAKADLFQAEDALKAFQGKNKALDLAGQAKASIEGVAQLRAQLAMHEVQLETLRRQYTGSAQEVKTLKATVDNIRAQIANLEGNSGGGSIPSIGSVPALGQEYARLMRSFKIQEAIVEVLTKQYEMAKLDESRDVSSLQVVQKARVPDKKSKPKRAKLVLAATAGALLCSVVLAFLLEHVRGMAPAEKESWRRLLLQVPLLRRLVA